MYHIIYDVKATYEKLNKTFADMGFPLRIEDFFGNEMRCVSIITNEKHFENAKEILKKQQIDIDVKVNPVGLDWLPKIYYVSVRNSDVLKALSLLEQVSAEKLDVSGVIERLSEKRASTERVLTRLGLFFLVTITFAANFMTISIISTAGWEVSFLLILMSLGLIIITALSAKNLCKKRRQGLNNL